MTRLDEDWAAAEVDWSGVFAAIGPAAPVPVSPDVPLAPRAPWRGSTITGGRWCAGAALTAGAPTDGTRRPTTERRGSSGRGGCSGSGGANSSTGSSIGRTTMGCGAGASSSSSRAGAQQNPPPTNHGPAGYQVWGCILSDDALDATAAKSGCGARGLDTADRRVRSIRDAYRPRRLSCRRSTQRSNSSHAAVLYAVASNAVPAPATTCCPAPRATMPAPVVTVA